MLTEREVISTINMLRSEHLDVRTVTLGINLFDCASENFSTFEKRSGPKSNAMRANSCRPATPWATGTGFPSSISAFP